jgi:antitoxin ParD1/3/4
VVRVPSRNIKLTEHQEQLIDSLVGAGVYQDADDVIRDGLRLVERDRREFETRLKALREALQVGWDDIGAGRYMMVTNEAERTALWDEIDRQVEVRRAARQAES